MKSLMVIILTASLLFSCSLIASAEMLFGVSAETGSADFSADYSLASGVSKSPDLLILTGDLNLLGLHINLEYGTADMDPYEFSTTSVQVGWELGLSIFKAKVFGGYQQYVLTDTIDYAFVSLVGGLGFESKINQFTIYGTTLIPVLTRFSYGSSDDDNADVSYLKLGIAYAPLPMVDLFVNYRAMTADSNVLDISSKGYTLGAKISF